MREWLLSEVNNVTRSNECSSTHSTWAFESVVPSECWAVRIRYSSQHGSYVPSALRVHLREQRFLRYNWRNGLSCMALSPDVLIHTRNRQNWKRFSCWCAKLTIQHFEEVLVPHDGVFFLTKISKERTAFKTSVVRLITRLTGQG